MAAATQPAARQPNQKMRQPRPANPSQCTGAKGIQPTIGSRMSLSAKWYQKDQCPVPIAGLPNCPYGTWRLGLPYQFWSAPISNPIPIT